MGYDLHQLAKTGRLDQVPEHLLTLKTILETDINAVSFLQRTTLHWAAWYGHLDQVPNQLLTLETMLVKDKLGNTPLHWAAWGGYLAQVPKRLLTQETMLLEDDYGSTPLHWAVAEGHLEQLLGIDFGDSEEFKKIVGEDWWTKNDVLLRQKQVLELEAEASDVDLF